MRRPQACDPGRYFASRVSPLFLPHESQRTVYHITDHVSAGRSVRKGTLGDCARLGPASKSFAAAAANSVCFDPAAHLFPTIMSVSVMQDLGLPERFVPLRGRVRVDPDAGC